MSFPSDAARIASYAPQVTRVPFDHWVIDDFFDPDVAQALVNERMPLSDPRWLRYDSDYQVKCACNNWNAFPEYTYSIFAALCALKFSRMLSEFTDREVIADVGLHGGGWHAHGNGGKLDPHLDYDEHPKLHLQRKLNLIVYLTPGMKPEYGGHLGLYDGDAEKPLALVHEIAPLFNRAVIFDTTQNSWHGMSRPLSMPDGMERRSIAVYYVSLPRVAFADRQRAIFRSAP